MLKDPFGDFACGRIVRIDPLLGRLEREIARKVRQFGDAWKERGVVLMNTWVFLCVAQSLEAAEEEMLTRSGEPFVPWPDVPSFLPIHGLHVFPSDDITTRPFELVERMEA